MDRISTFNQQRLFISQALEVQKRYAAEQTQEATSIKSLTYDGYGADSRTIISLETDLKMADQYVSSGTIVAARVQGAYSAVTSIVDITTSARTWLSSLLSGATDDISGANVQAMAYLDEVASLLNTDIDGYYVFAGSALTTAPVDIGSYAATDAATIDTSYYQGSASGASYEAAPGLTIEYSSNAGGSGFEKLMRSLSLAAQASEDPADLDTMQDAYDLLDQAIDEITVEQSRLSGIANSVDDAMDRNVDFQLYVDSLVDDLKSVDVAEITAKLSATELQLETSYSVLKALQSINLLDYL
ncbi:flagellin [Dongia sp.]|uniref:flagellin n=1 Tax=Dongia sp. TaxID=1977262 RepID=UPI0035B04AF0